MKFSGLSQISPCLYAALLLLFMPLAAHSQGYMVDPPSARNIVLENVVLIDRSGEVKDMKVSIRIRDQKLDMVTQDALQTQSDELVLNANDGVLMGDLNLGEAPNFMILDGDPR